MNDQNVKDGAFKIMIKQSNEVDNLIKKKKDILENRAKEAVVDFDVIFYQFKIIEKNMYGHQSNSGQDQQSNLLGVSELIL